MEFAVNYFTISFSDESSKKAYLAACEWVAKNIMTKKDKENSDLQDTYWKIERDEEEETPTFKLQLYATIKAKEFEDQFCTICKQTHTSFFMNTGYNCNACNKKAYMDRAKKKLKIKRSYRKELIDKRLNKEF